MVVSPLWYLTKHGHDLPWQPENVITENYDVTVKLYGMVAPDVMNFLPEISSSLERERRMDNLIWNTSSFGDRCQGGMKRVKK